MKFNEKRMENKHFEMDFFRGCCLDLTIPLRDAGPAGHAALRPGGPIRQRTVHGAHLEKAAAALQMRPE